MERLDIVSFVVGSSKFLASHKVGSRVEIYSARWKLMLISDQAKDLVKIVWKAEAAFHYTGQTGPRPLGLTKGKWNASEPKVRPN